MNEWLHARRLVAWSAVFLAVVIALFVLLTLSLHNIVLPVGRSSSIDFASFYAAGKLALAGTPELAYDQAAHYVAEQQAREPGMPYVFFYYPPMFLLPCAVLATLPYLPAYFVFQIATFIPFALVLKRALGVSGWAWLLPVIAFPATFWNIGEGQNAFLSVALLGGFALCLDRRPIAAGAMLGALCFKPHLGLLTPVALAAARRWTAMAAAAASFAGLVTLSLVLFGWPTWRAYFAAMAGADQVYTTGRINFAGFVSLFGGLRLLEVRPAIAYAAQALVALAMASLVAVVWRRGSAPAAIAFLLAATLIAVPLVLLYDQLIAVLAVAFLLQDARRDGLRTWEKITLVLAYPLALMSPIIAIGVHIPLGIIVSLAVTGLCLRRALLPAA